jgi:hypothetical protein
VVCGFAIENDSVMITVHCRRFLFVRHRSQAPQRMFAPESNHQPGYSLFWLLSHHNATTIEQSICAMEFLIIAKLL